MDAFQWALKSVATRFSVCWPNASGHEKTFQDLHKKRFEVITFVSALGNLTAVGSSYLFIYILF